MPMVSIVVPNYNHGRYLPKRIESVLRQSYDDFELILLDDCSTDESRAVLSGYSSDSRVRFAFNDVNSGSPFKQWNKGIELARGKYVWIAESDDYADRQFLERLVPVLEDDERVAYAYCRSWRVTAKDEPKGFEDEYLPHQGSRGWGNDYNVDGRRECRDNFLFVNAVPNASAVLLRKCIYEKAGGADVSFTLCGDWKLWATLALVGRVVYMSRALNFYRKHEGTQRKRTVRHSVSVLESLRIVRWLANCLELSEAERKPVYKAHAAGWVPELMSLHVPLKVKLEIWRNVTAFDPHPIRRIWRPAWETVHRSLAHAREHNFRGLVPGTVASNRPDDA